MLAGSAAMELVSALQSKSVGHVVAAGGSTVQHSAAVHVASVHVMLAGSAAMELVSALQSKSVGHVGQVDATGVPRAVQPPSIRACFSSITNISVSLHELVHRPVQIVSTMPAMGPVMISVVKVGATH